MLKILWSGMWVELNKDDCSLYQDYSLIRNGLKREKQQLEGQTGNECLRAHFWHELNSSVLLYVVPQMAYSLLGLAPWLGWLDRRGLTWRLSHRAFPRC